MKQSIILLLLLAVPASDFCRGLEDRLSIKDLNLDFAAELSREIGWWEAGPRAEPATGKVVYSTIVRRFNLFCFEGSCHLTVLSIAKRNCADEKSGTTAPVLETTLPGSDVDVFEMQKDGSGDLKVSQVGKDSLLIQFVNQDLVHSSGRISLNYKELTPGGTKAAVEVSGNEAGVGVDNVARNSDYRQLRPSTVCAIRVSGPAT